MIDLKDKDTVFIYNIAGGTEAVWDINQPPHELAMATERKTNDSKPLHELLSQIKKNNKTIRVERERKVIYIG